MDDTYIFDVGTRVDSDNITVLDAEIVSNNSVHAGRTIVKIIVGENNQNGVLALLTLDQDCVSSEEL
jgi:hypothetical protein